MNSSESGIAIGKLFKLTGMMFFVALGSGLAWWRATAPAPVAVEQPTRGPVVEEVFGTGTLESKIVVGISAKIVGKVTEVLVDQGDAVTAGQSLARLEARDFEDNVRVAEAKLAQADAELAKAKLDWERARALFEGRTISQAQLDAAQTDYRITESRRNTASAELGVARARLGDTVITSPIAGLVITRNLETGSTVVPGSPIFRVADTKLLWMRAQVDEREAGKLELGQPARVMFRACGHTPIAGTLARLAQEADRVTEERQIDVAVERLPKNFFVGQKADVFIEVARRDNALRVPKSAIVNAGVLIVAHGRAQWRAVKLGLAGRDTVEVLEGLRDREIVVVNPLAGKKPIATGQRIKAVSAP